MTAWSQSVSVRLEDFPAAGGRCLVLVVLWQGKWNFNLNANVFTSQTDRTASVTAVLSVWLVVFLFFFALLCNKSVCLNVYNVLANDYLPSCLFKAMDCL